MSALAAELKALLEGRPLQQADGLVPGPAPDAGQGARSDYSMALNGDPLLSALKLSLGIG